MIRTFARTDYKFAIDEAQYARLVEGISRRLALDPSGDDFGSYRVASAYYDTPDLAFHRARLERREHRGKVRVRVYGDGPVGPDTPAALEIKQRRDGETHKRRAAMRVGEALAVCAGEPLTGASTAIARDRAVAVEVSAMARTLRLMPVCVVEYWRQAFVGTGEDAGLRVTFDRDVVGAGASSWIGLAGSPGHLAAVSPRALVSAGRLVMEVKAERALPPWLARALWRAGCRQARFSKYCTAVAHLTAPREPAGGDARTRTAA